MAKRADDQELTDEELKDLVKAGLEDQKAGRVVTVTNEQELREFWRRLRDGS